MANEEPELDATIQSLVQERAEANECIESWVENEPGEMVIFLVDKDVLAKAKESVRRGERGAGYGRSLQFKLTRGAWEFVSVGGWMA